MTTLVNSCYTHLGLCHWHYACLHICLPM